MECSNRLRLTEFEKLRIINSYEKQIQPTLIAKVLGRPISTVTSFWSNFCLHRHLGPKPKISKRQIDGAMGLAIKKIIQTNAKIGIRSIPGLLRMELPGEPWYPSRSTIHRFLKMNDKTKVKMRLKPPLSDVTKGKRIAFVDKWLINGQDTLGDVLWSDETTIRSHPSNRRIQVWVDKSLPKENIPVQEKRHTGGFSIMFWGVISKHGKGPLVALEGSMNGPKYIEVLQNELLPELEYCRENISDNFKLMQDNAQCHRSRLVKAWLQENNVDFIEWPPYSPNMNPIENLWAWVKFKLHSNYPPAADEDELFDFVVEIWESITDEMCASFCGNYVKRLEALKKSKGGYTKY